MVDAVRNKPTAVEAGTLGQPLENPTKRVLILVRDLYAQIGGGQSAYRSIVSATPQIQYYYFVEHESVHAYRPPNAYPISYKKFYYPNVGDLPAEMGHWYAEYIECWQFARSFAEAMPGLAIDVVDTPDYAMHGLFIRGALKSHGVLVGEVSLALHGTISSALRDEWGDRPSSRLLAEVRLRERLQYQVVDSRYALSEAYGEELTRQSGGYEPNYIDPLVIVGAMAAKPATSEEKPDLLFIGRRERRKGPDLFVDTLWSLERKSYKRARLIGSDSLGHSGVGADNILKHMAAVRGLDIQFVDPLPRAELDIVFESPVAVLLPSRYDQFNLVALEALRSGAPAFVSHAAGVSRWIISRFPELSFLTFDLNGARAAAGALRAALADYHGTRGKIVEALSKRNLHPDLSSLECMYHPNKKRAMHSIEAIRDICLRFDSFNRPREIVCNDTTAAVTTPLPIWKQRIINSPLRPAAEFYHHVRLRVQGAFAERTVAAPPPSNPRGIDICDRSPRSLGQMQAAVDIEGLRERLLHLPERTELEIAMKLRILSEEIPSKLIGRDALFRDFMRLERKRKGGALVAATYGMRLMRWAGEDRAGDVDFVAHTFEEHGFKREAEAIRTLYGDPAQTDQLVSNLLKNQYELQRVKSVEDYGIEDDRRGGVKPRVSVIVSLYNAEAKLLTFLRQLSAQTLFARNDIEVVLIDSGSPTREYAAFKAFMASEQLPILYVRTASRETIQSAWNRGIRLAKGKYLSFLGVDEGVRPDAYQLLADKLDADADVDWVMADSVVTNVDKQGTFVSDVMTYDRQGYNQCLVYLETCYLSWVGGLYRKSIHERFGFYDETFRGAGDTEFKSRVLPHIKSAHLRQTLGIFLNYPEERATQHPRAEIEDLRAWYLYRTRAGVAYVWDSKPIAEVELFFRACLRYRKSYCGHWSTDFEMAHAVAQYMVERGENAKFAAAALTTASDMLTRMRSLDAIDYRLSPDERQSKVRLALQEAKLVEEEAVEAFALAERPRFEIYNDNRYEQHWYSWSG